MSAIKICRVSLEAGEFKTQTSFLFFQLRRCKIDNRCRSDCIWFNIIV
eukprot:UN10332